jgi:tRNA(adenine34) deaminase
MRAHSSMDRASDYGSEGWGFKSSWAHFSIFNAKAIIEMHIKTKHKLNNETIQPFIAIALKEALKAYNINEVPVAALVLKDGILVSKAHNLVESAKDPTRHAELIAIQKALKKLNTTRLNGCEMLATLEPCSMCAGAIVLARIDALYILAKDEKAGACGSVLSVIPNQKLNHRPTVVWYDNSSQYIALLHQFFAKLRS